MAVRIRCKVRDVRGWLMALLVLAVADPAGVTLAKDPVEYVDPIIGAGSTVPTKEEAARLTLDPNFPGFHGKLFPGACTPAGMVQLSPDTITGGDNGAGYSYPHTTIQGFSVNHMSGVGAYGDLGNFMVMATTGPLQTYWGETDHPGTGYLSSYDKSTESAAAGYYAVTLDDPHTRVELTATPRCGILRFTFLKDQTSRIQVDLARRIGGISQHQTVKVTDDHTIEGQIDCLTTGGGFRHGGVHYTVYYHAEFSKPFGDVGVWSATLPSGKANVMLPRPEFAEACRAAVHLPGCREKEGEHLGFYAEYPTAANEHMELKVGISYVNLEGARANLAAEIPAWDFDVVRQQAKTAWADALGRLAVEGGTDAQKTIFYTAAYHALIDPRICSDVNGSYRGGDEEVHQAAGYTRRTVFSGWDVYRSQYPLLTIIAPEIVNDQINSAVSLAEENKTHYFDRWELMHCYTGCMCGNPEVVVINDAYQKGIRQFDVAKAYDDSAVTCAHFSNGPAGFSTGDHGVAVTLENAFAEWNLGRLGKELGHDEDARKYTTRGAAYRELFDGDAPWTYDRAGKVAHAGWKGWIHGKAADGTWIPWEGLTSGKGGEESSLYQTGWFFPQDVPGLIDLLGGQAMFVDKLNDFFEHTPQLTKSNPYYDQTNEPSQLIPFLFNRAGAPWLTQKWVRTLVTQTYGNHPNGLCGDDDEGQVSAWFVLAASGLHQACPGDPRFEIFTPLFDKVTLHLSSVYSHGGTFEIVARNNSAENIYIQSASLNGKPIGRCWLDFHEIAAGGTLELILGPTPNKAWGID